MQLLPAPVSKPNRETAVRMRPRRSDHRIYLHPSSPRLSYTQEHHVDFQMAQHRTKPLVTNMVEPRFENTLAQLSTHPTVRRHSC